MHVKYVDCHVVTVILDQVFWAILDQNNQSLFKYIQVMEFIFHSFLSFHQNIGHELHSEIITSIPNSALKSTTTQFRLIQWVFTPKSEFVMWCNNVFRTNLGANEQVGDTGRILLQLGHPFFTHILETGGVDHREADEEDVGHRVGQRPQAVVVLLREDGKVTVNRVKRHDSFLSASEDYYSSIIKA